MYKKKKKKKNERKGRKTRLFIEKVEIDEKKSDGDLCLTSGNIITVTVNVNKLASLKKKPGEVSITTFK